MLEGRSNQVDISHAKGLKQWDLWASWALRKPEAAKNEAKQEACKGFNMGSILIKQVDELPSW